MGIVLLFSKIKIHLSPSL